MKIKKLKETYEFACNEYVQKFCNKQEMTNECWSYDDDDNFVLDKERKDKYKHEPSA